MASECTVVCVHIGFLLSHALPSHGNGIPAGTAKHAQSVQILTSQLFLQQSWDTSYWTELDHSMTPEPITEARGLENLDWLNLSHMPISGPMGRTSSTQTTWSEVSEGLSPSKLEGL